jgi:hypothetical protein
MYRYRVVLERGSFKQEKSSERQAVIPAQAGIQFFASPVGLETGFQPALE